MKLDYQKELSPVLYGDSAVKIINQPNMKAGTNCFSLHWHDRMELLFIHSGSLVVNDGNRSYEVPAGRLAIFAPGNPHGGTAGENGVSYHTVMFDISKFYNATGASNRFLTPLHEQRILFEPTTDNPEVVASVKEVLTLHENTGDCSSLIAVGEIYRLVGLLLKYCLSQKQTIFHDSGRFKEVLEFVNQNFSCDISSLSLSRKFGYDETYFCRRFKSVTGLTPMIYIRILRLEKARKLIKQGGITLADVAADCGFSEQGYFTRCFKKHFGITPGEYALKYKK